MPNQIAWNPQNFQHCPVMATEVKESIKKLPPELLNGGLMIDATLGGGGHCSLLLDEFPNLRVIGLDQDPNARFAAAKHLTHFGSRVQIVATNFSNFTPPQKAIFVLADLGVSSPQFDEAKRGFSFREDGPLDMRMDQTQGLTAAKLIEDLNETELANIIYAYGEERFSRRIARRIKNDLAEQGAYKGTAALGYAIAGCYPPKMRHGRIHPATRTFQAIRIAVNNELEVLDKFLKRTPDWLLAEGLLAVISFHSLEDRRVKTSFMKDKRLEKITKKPLQPSSWEIEQNPRSRSAKLRVARKNTSQD